MVEFASRPDVLRLHFVIFLVGKEENEPLSRSVRQTRHPNCSVQSTGEVSR